MFEVVKLFRDLSSFYCPHLCWNQVEEIYEKDRKNSSRKLAREAEDKDNDEDISDEERSLSDSDIESDFDSGEDDVALSSLCKFNTVKSIPMVRQSIQNPEVVAILLELSTAIRNLRQSNIGYDNTLDDWNVMKNIAPKDQYLAFIYSLLGLAKYNPTSKVYRKLSMAAASTYILSLTIPGSKPYGILDENIVTQAIEVFHLINEMQGGKISKKISPQDRVEIWVNFSNLGDDLKILFRYVHFDKYESMKESIIRELSKILFNNHLHGYENTYAANLHSKCFEILEEIINAHNGPPKDTLMKIVKINLSLHFLPPTPKRKQAPNISDRNTFEHISDWLVSLITKHPSILSSVLKNYIQYVVTNLEKDIKGEYLQRALDYAAKYDAALYTHCNESIVEYLCDAANADDIQIRTNATELLIRIAKIESKVNWEVFRHEISSIPREVHIIKEIINRLHDVNNTVKLRALHGFLQIYTNGTEDSRKIITECIKFTVFDSSNVELPEEPRSRSKEIKFQVPDELPPDYTFEGTDLIKESFLKLPKILYFLLHNNSVNVKKAALTVLEPLIALNPLIIYKTNFVKECSKLSGDPTIIVRRQGLVMIDSILERYPNCYPVIFVWCKIIVPLFQDSDEKIVAYAWECFKKRVFDNIRGMESSNMAEHYMPWRIIRLLLSSHQRLFLQGCINSAINKKVINAQSVALIESHTFTSNSTEAWTMLGFIAGKIKSKEPDSLISAFTESMEDHSWNVRQNIQIILEVLTISMKDFSHSALNMAFSCIIKLLKSGKLPPNLIAKAFDFCMAISKHSENKKGKKKNVEAPTKHHLEWVKELQDSVESYLTENLRNFNQQRKIIMPFLFVYSEANLELPIRPKEFIIKFIHEYLRQYLKAEDRDFEPEDVHTLNQIIILAARFSIRDPNVANTTCLLYRAILRRTDRTSTVNNVIDCITDLCKKHTQIVELSLSEVLNKLQSPYLDVRLITFNNLAQLILSDLMKFRGHVLLCFMTTLLDKATVLSNRSSEFFLTYLEKKNPMLFQSALLECPFVFNEYMHFEGLDNFSGMEGRTESPLKGDDKAKSRHLLYKVFMQEQEEVALLMLFNHLKLIHAKIKENDTINSKEGLAMIKDVFYILQHICILGLEKKDSKNAREDDEHANGEDENDQSKQTAGKSEPQPGKKGRKSNVMTLEQAIALVEKSLHFLPQISEKLLDWDKTFEKPIEDMMVAICTRFDNLVEFNEPAKFWSKYRNLAKQQGSSGRKRKSDSKIADSNSDDEDDEEARSEKSKRSNTSDTISILFKPFFN